jgi:single-stranded-DNA-specific exonuclease
LNQCRWRILPQIPAGHPINAAEYSPLLKQILYNRGLTGPAAAEAFFNADNRLSGDPWLLPDIDKAVQRTQQALLSGEKIAVYGDFDVDGISATALMVKGLERLGGNVIPYIPHRLQEGHGLNSYALTEIREHDASLVITVDCGITGTAQMQETRKSRLPALDMIITDHHLPLDILPPAIAVVDPKRRDSRYPFTDLAGVGVAYKVLQALYQGLGKENEATQFLDLVALGTVGDMMPLVGENRYLVKAGLEHLRDTKRPGLRELASQAGVKLEKADAQDISFGLAPRLNAAGRLEHAISAYNLLVTESADEARTLAGALAEQNNERQRLTAAAMTHAREQVLSKGISPVLIARDAGYAGGVLGLVAGRLCDEFYHPAVVVQLGDEVCHGSCRSIPEFNITEAISQCADLLTRFGGHAQAAGFTLLTANLPEFEERLNQIAVRELSAVDLRPQIEIDALVRFYDLGGTAYAQTQRLAPFGMGNAAPVFLSRETLIADCRSMGSSGAHLKFKLKQGTSLWDAVAFGMGERTVDVQVPLDIVYNLEQDDWNGESRLRLNILDFAPAGANI